MTYTIDVHVTPDEVHRRMRADALAGLLGDPKSIPPVWFYDERGSQLFEEITRLPSTTRRAPSGTCWKRTLRRSPNTPRRTRWSSSEPGPVRRHGNSSVPSAISAP